MAWSTPSALSTGTLVTAATWNQDVKDNAIALRAGALAVTSQAAGDVIVASSTTQLSRTANISVAQGGTGVATLTANSLLLGAGTSDVTFAAPGTSGNVLTSNGTVWASATPATATSLDTGTVAYAGRTITVDTGGVLNVVLASSAGDDFTVDTTRLVVSGDETAVGINTAAPVSLLDVRGPTGTGTAPAGLLTLATNELTIVDNDQLGRIEFRSPIATAGTDAIVSAASIWAEANATFSASVNSADIVFATATSGAATEKMRILSSGNVGIGTTAPVSPLTVIGITTLSRADTTPAGTASTVYDDVVMGSTDTTNTGMTIFGTGQVGIAFGDAGSNSAGQIRYQHPSDKMELIVADSVVGMTILSSGNVGIGTASPASTLDVNGVVALDGLRVETNDKTSAYTLLATDFNVTADAVGGAFSVTLIGSPTDGQTYTIRRVNSGANDVTIAGNSVNINGESSIALTLQYESVILIYNSSDGEWGVY